MAKNLIAMDDPFYADDFERDKLLRLTGSLLGYSEFGGGKWAVPISSQIARAPLSCFQNRFW
jgi:hypothetical protein